MRKTFLILFVCAFALAARAQEFKTIKPGVEYAQFVRELKASDNAAPRVVVNALRLDLTKVRLDVHHALDAAIGVEKTSSIARRHNAFAAINGGFFRIDNSIFRGDTLGVLVVDKQILSEQFGERIAVFIANEAATKITFQRFVLFYQTVIKKQRISTNGINRERKENELIKYTPEFHRTTLTNDDGVEIIVRNDKIVQIKDRSGNNSIPENGFVLSAVGKARDDILKAAKIGRKANWEIETVGIGAQKVGDKYTSVYNSADDVLGGAPQLIKNGKIEITWEAEKLTKAFAETKHPRTAIAKLKDGRALLVAVDGRSDQSAGMSLQETAEMLLEMNAVEAMNLDGGGSTTMFLDGKIVNKPSDKEGERAVSDAILVTLRK